ncbi:MAG: hypothetical protein FWE63_07785 [Bacteroidales bacterium]|nr:hypothetical protein [Bacteroidales bacterium]
MKNRNLIICLLAVMFFAEQSFCAESDSTRTEKNSEKAKFIIGATGGLSQNNFLSGDLYCGVSIPLKSDQLEINFGYSTFSNKATYRGVKNLQFKSHGLFIEGNYVLSSGLYFGLRVAFNLNWVDENSQKLFDNYTFKSPTFFSGKAFYGQIGYYYPIGTSIGIKGQFQIGLHNYKIAEGRYWQFGNSNDPIRDAQLGVEWRIGFLYNLSVGFILKL